jgi:hypothetical protein
MKPEWMPDDPPESKISYNSFRAYREGSHDTAKSILKRLREQCPHTKDYKINRFFCPKCMSQFEKEVREL